jgi:hypothetical protein
MPSDITLYDGLHIACYINDNNKTYIHSLAGISDNEYFNCVEFINLNNALNFGIKIFKNQKSHVTYFFNQNVIN